MPVFLSNAARDRVWDVKRYRTWNIVFTLLSIPLLYIAVFLYPLPPCDFAHLKDPCTDAFVLGALLCMNIAFQVFAYFSDGAVPKVCALMFGPDVVLLFICAYFQ